VIRIAVMTFGAGLTVPSCDLVVLPLATGPVFLPESTFFSMATVTLQILIEQLSATSYSKRIATLREHQKSEILRKPPKLTQANHPRVKY
jgi:hypothetical protein